MGTCWRVEACTFQRVTHWARGEGREGGGQVGVAALAGGSLPQTQLLGCSGLGWAAAGPGSS